MQCSLHRCSYCHQHYVFPILERGAYENEYVCHLCSLRNFHNLENTIDLYFKKIKEEKEEKDYIQ